VVAPDDLDIGGLLAGAEPRHEWSIAIGRAGRGVLDAR